MRDRVKEKQEYSVNLFHLLYSTITKKANITTVRLSPVITFSFHHAGDHFFFLELVLVTLLLGAQEPDDGEDNVIVGEGWRVVEADSTKRSCGACNHILEQNKLQFLFWLHLILTRGICWGNTKSVFYTW